MKVRECPACGTPLPPAGEGTEATFKCPACGRRMKPPSTFEEEQPETLSLPPGAIPQEPPTLMADPVASGTPPPRLPEISGYEVLEELGRGGMGVVYKARQTFPRRLVALKMILGGDLSGPERVARFRAEIAAAARLQHPHVVQIHEVGEHGGRPFFAMEYVDGGTLARRLARGPLPPKEAAQLVEPLARAVQHAHDRGILHRDLKPSNVLLVRGEASSTGSGKSGGGSLAIPKITDFGLAKHLEGASSVAVGPRTQSGAILGTPGYMAPEQTGSRGQTVGPPADIYALGAILYECLTGRPPFLGPTPLETLMKVATEDPVPPRALRPELPRDLNIICLKCLMKTPQSRYATAGDLAADLRRHLDGEPIQARPQSVLQRVGRWMKRKREVVFLGLGLLLAGLIGLGVWAFQPPRPPETPPIPPKGETTELPPDLRLIPETALGFVSIRPADLWGLPDPHELSQVVGRQIGGQPLTDLADMVAGVISLGPEEIERATLVFADLKNPENVVGLLAPLKPVSADQLRTHLARRGKHLPQEHGGKTIYATAAGNEPAICLVEERVLVLGRIEHVRSFVSPLVPMTPAQILKPSLDRAAGKRALVAGVRPTATQLADVFIRLRLPAEVDPVARIRAAGVEIAIETEQGADGEKRLEVSAWLDYAEAGQCEGARPHAARVMKAMLNSYDRDFRPLLTPRGVDRLLTPIHAASWQVDQTSLRAQATAPWKLDEIKGFLQEAAEGAKTEDHLRRIATALRSYHSRNGQFPPAAVVDEAGKPLYSWRVLLLPYLGGETLYRRFHLNRAWDHPSNAGLSEQMPTVFASPRPGVAPQTTPYQVITGRGGLFDDTEGRRLNEIIDGAARTLLVAEAAEAVPWTKPADLSFDGQHLPQLAGRTRGGFRVALADGSVRTYVPETPDLILRALITRAGKETDLGP